jgi:hypothetical protein
MLQVSSAQCYEYFDLNAQLLGGYIEEKRVNYVDMMKSIEPGA